MPAVNTLKEREILGFISLNTNVWDVKNLVKTHQALKKIRAIQEDIEKECKNERC